MAGEKEPLKVKLGESFKPFAGVNSLDDLTPVKKTTDTLFETIFFLEGLGLGRVNILGHESLLEDQEGNFLDLSKGRPRLFHVAGPIGRIGVSIDRMPESIVAEPNLICRIRLEGKYPLELTSIGMDTTVAANEGPAFLWFSRRANEEPRELIIDASPVNLRKIILIIDRNQ